MYRAYGTRNPEGWWRQRIEIRCDNINRADGSTCDSRGGWLQRIEIRCDNINRADGSTCMMLVAYFFGLLPLVKCSPIKRGVASTNLSTTDFNPLVEPK
jgi:hypothetical protein